MPIAFYPVLLAQFIAALGDHALLIVAIARQRELAAAAWAVPLLKFILVLSYVWLAPFVGALADAWPKRRVMWVANAIKLVAIFSMVAGADPLLGLGLVGVGAALYAPAKYGLMCELLPAHQLVRANGFIEACTVCAVVLGTVLGGWLVSGGFLDGANPALDATLTWGVVDRAWDAATAQTELAPAWLGLMMLYAAAGAVNLRIADSGARYPSASFHPVQLLRRFACDNAVLWRDPLGRLSMAVTTLLWGVGATLQLIVLRWAEDQLHLPLHQAAYLQGTSAVGVIVGAALASRWVRLEHAQRLLPLGVLMGVLLPLMNGIHSVPLAAGMMALVGAMAGFFVVPMNALLQHRGHTLLTAGRSIAVQGFNENGGMLLMLLLYAAATALHLPLPVLIVGFGVLVTLTLLLLIHLNPTRKPVMAMPACATPPSGGHHG